MGLYSPFVSSYFLDNCKLMASILVCIKLSFFLTLYIKPSFIRVKILSLLHMAPLSLFKDVPLRTRWALSPKNMYSDSALLVLNRTSLNIDSALLVLNRASLNIDSALLALNRRHTCTSIQYML